MSDVLCLYYSRTGRTEETMKEIAAALNAELARITDDVDRSGLRGFLHAGREAMRTSTHPIDKLTTERPLEDYRLVILGGPVWGGRCASPVRALLKRRGLELSRVAYVLTRSSGRKYEEVYSQMDLYTAQKHVLGASLRPGSVGYTFWLERFVRDVERYLEQ